MNLAFSTRLRRSLSALVLVGAAVVAPSFANAGNISFSIVNESPATNSGTGGTGSFDVVITDTTADTIGQFQVDLLLSQGLSAITFTNATISTAATYVFNGNSSLQSNNGSPFFADTEAANSDLTNSGTATLGAALGLMHVVYNVPAGTPVGDYALTFNQDDPNVDPFADFTSPTNTSAVDTSPFSAPSGAIHVTPEPSSIVMLILGAVGLFGFRRLRTR